MGLDFETFQVDFEYNNFMTIKKKRTKKNVFYCNLCLNRSGTFQILCSALNNDVLMFLHTSVSILNTFKSLKLAMHKIKLTLRISVFKKWQSKELLVKTSKGK